MRAAITSNFFLRKAHANRGMLFPLACIALLLVMLIPLPRPVLDLLLIFNLTLSVIILVTAIYVQSPLEFAVLPSVLLAITLFRLVLNVATTRLILTGDGTESSAGEVVRTFSSFVTAGSVTVGAIIFAIIFVIQFVVITKGGTRISEVAARFKLDALPGKQMAIDAEVNQGALTHAEASKKRDDLARETDFYAAMEGAGKFVRGDAIAAVIITIVNILGGLYVGIVEKGIAPFNCMTMFTKLTIGDGLVSQVPAFIVALAAGLMVTRTTAKSDLGEDMISQMLSRPKALIVATIFLAMLAFTGLPKLPLLILAACCVGIAYLISAPQAQIEETDAAKPQAAEETVTKLLDIEVIELELGRGLVRFTEPERGGDLVDRLSRMKRQIATELGLLVPSVHVTYNPQLDVNDYAIKLRGQTIARGVTYPDQFLAIDEGEAASPISAGDETEEPGTGRLAYWITESQGSEADQLCYRVVEAPAVLINHLTEVIRDHAAELLTRQNVKELLDNLRARCGAVVDEVIPDQVKPGELQKVLQNLLRERVPIRDLETIVETAGDYSCRTKDVELLTEFTRAALGRTICKQYVDESDRLSCLVLASPLEQLITGHVEQSDDTTMHTMPPHTSQQIAVQIADLAVRNERDGRAPVVLCSPSIRAAVRKILESTAPQLAVLSVAEVTGDVAPDIVAVVGEEGVVELQGAVD